MFHRRNNSIQLFSSGIQDEKEKKMQFDRDGLTDKCTLTKMDSQMKTKKKKRKKRKTSDIRVDCNSIELSPIIVIEYPLMNSMREKEKIQSKTIVKERTTQTPHRVTTTFLPK